MEARRRLATPNAAADPPSVSTVAERGASTPTPPSRTATIVTFACIQLLLFAVVDACFRGEVEAQQQRLRGFEVDAADDGAALLPGLVVRVGGAEVALMPFRRPLGGWALPLRRWSGVSLCCAAAATPLMLLVRAVPSPPSSGFPLLLLLSAGYTAALAYGVVEALAFVATAMPPHHPQALLLVAGGVGEAMAVLGIDGGDVTALLLLLVVLVLVQAAVVWGAVPLLWRLSGWSSACLSSTVSASSLASSARLPPAKSSPVPRPRRRPLLLLLLLLVLCAAVGSYFALVSSDIEGVLRHATTHSFGARSTHSAEEEERNDALQEAWTSKEDDTARTLSFSPHGRQRVDLFEFLQSRRCHRRLGRNLMQWQKGDADEPLVPPLPVQQHVAVVQSSVDAVVQAHANATTPPSSLAAAKERTARMLQQAEGKERTHVMC